MTKKEGNKKLIKLIIFMFISIIVIMACDESFLSLEQPTTSTANENFQVNFTIASTFNAQSKYALAAFMIPEGWVFNNISEDGAYTFAGWSDNTSYYANDIRARCGQEFPGYQWLVVRSDNTMAGQAISFNATLNLNATTIETNLNLMTYGIGNTGETIYLNFSNCTNPCRVRAYNSDSNLGHCVNPVVNITGNGSNHQLGSIFNGIRSGDINNDGFFDLVISSYTKSDQLFIYLGINNGYLDFDMDQGDTANISMYNFSNRFAVGDINGDGYSDLLGVRTNELKIIFGNANPSNINISETPANITIFVSNGSAVASADINADGYDDIIIGAGLNDYGGLTSVGQTFVIYGGNNIPSYLNLSETNANISISGRLANEGAGSNMELTTGDINGDNYSDIMIGQIQGSYNGDGIVHVVYGSALPFSINLSQTPANVSILEAETNNAYLGLSVASGDINADGYDDIVVGARSSDVDERTSAGQVYVIYGKEGNYEVNLSYTNANITISGDDRYDFLGDEVHVADLNLDNYSDLIIGATSWNGYNEKGKVHVIFGSANPFDVDLNNTYANLTFYHSQGDDEMFGSSLWSNDFNNDSYPEIFVAAYSANSNGVASTGEVLVINFLDYYNIKSNITLTLANDTLTTDNTPQLTWTNTTEPNNGSMNFYIEIYNSTTFSDTYKVNASVVSNQYSFTPADLVDDVYYWRVLGYDGLENNSWSDNYTLTVDSHPPSVTLSLSSSGIKQYETQTITCSTTDGLDTNPSLSIRVTSPSQEVYTYTESPADFSTTGGAGTYSVNCQSYDDLSNLGEASSTFTVSYSRGQAGSGGGSNSPTSTQDNTDETSGTDDDTIGGAIDNIKQEIIEEVIEEVVKIDEPAVTFWDKIKKLFIRILLFLKVVDRV